MGVVRLGLETTGRLVSAALAEGDRVFAEASIDRSTTGSEGLVGLVDRIQREGRLDPARLDEIVVDRGPGSFTGIRVGLATARALGLGWGKPVRGVIATEVWRSVVSEPGATVVVLLDMRRGEIAVESFTAGSGADPVARSGLVLVAAEAIPEWLRTMGLDRARAVRLAGDAAPSVLDRVRALLPGACGPRERHIDAAAVCRAAASGFATHEVEPFYIRPPDARLPEPGAPRS
jgi:tRNA threonylcarbamoyladenosine biosynthesis protein TsaB